MKDESTMQEKVQHFVERVGQRRLLSLLAVFIGIIVVLGSLPVFAAFHTNTPTPAPRVALTDALPPVLAKAQRLNPLVGSQLITLAVSLRLPDMQRVANLIERQNEPRSTQYHKYLTTQQFTDRFAPSQANVATLTALLRGAGFTIQDVAANRMLIDVTGTVAQANKLFATTLYNYSLDQQHVFGPAQTPTIPQSLASVVQNVTGLNSLEVSHPLWLQSPTQATQPQPLAALSPQTPQVIDPHPRSGFSPSNLRDAYDVSALINNGGNGSTERVAVFEQGPYLAGDVNTYRSTYGLPNSPINNYTVDGAGSVGDASGTLEADLDIEVTSALAPNATIDVLTGPNTFTGANDLYNLFVTTNQDKVLTTSWGQCEPQTGAGELNTLHNLFVEAAVQGQTLLAAAGDTGSDDCYNRDAHKPSGLAPSTDSPADDPYILGVGGTTLSFNGSYNGESVWNARGVSGGGGLSTFFQKPSWQMGIGTINKYEYNQREVPDITGVADQAPGFNTYCTSVHDCSISGAVIGWAIVGGTSATAPMWAGVLADINTYLKNHSANPLGWANQRLYQLYAYSINNRGATYGMFNDVTTGNNDIDYSGSPYSGDYPATSCFDLASGMGSLNAWNIAQVALSGPAGTRGPCAAPTLGGDGVGAFNPANNTFSLRKSLSSGAPDFTLSLGNAGDIPIVGDWNGDGIATAGVYRPSTGVFYLTDANTQGAPIPYAFPFGPLGCIPLVGDWTGSGHDSVGVFYPQNDTFYLRNSLSGGNADYAANFGFSGVYPITGDWTGQGQDTIGVYDPTTATFYLKTTISGGNADYGLNYGVPGWLPFSGDWTHSGRSGIGVYNPATSTFYLRNDPTTSGYADFAFPFGSTNSKPLAGFWGN